MDRSAEKFEFEEPVTAAQASGLHKRSLLYKVVKTTALVLIWICSGLWSEINGPTLQDLMCKTGMDYDVISSSFSMRGAGSLVGGLTGGVLIDRFRHRADMILAVSLLICAALNIIIPYSPYVELLFVVFGMEGIMEAYINIAGQWLVMQIWQERASGPLHLLHLGYGAGGFLVPQIVANFISEALPKADEKLNPKCLANISSTLNVTDNLNVTINVTALTDNTITPRPFVPSDKFQYGFFIVSGIIAFVAFIFFVYAFIARKEKAIKEMAKQHKTLRQIFDLNTCSPGHPYFAFILYALMFCWIYAAVAGERVFAKYLYSYAREEQCFDKTEALNLQTAFWLSFTGGRFLGFVCTNFVPMKFVIFIEGFGVLIPCIVLYFFSAERLVLWVFSCMAGIFIGPCFPSGLAWTNRYIEVTGVGVTVLSVAGGVSDLSFVGTLGTLLTNYGISVLITVILGYGMLVAVLPIVQQSIAHTKGDRFEQIADDSEITD